MTNTKKFCILCCKKKKSNLGTQIDKGFEAVGCVSVSSDYPTSLLWKTEEGRYTQ